MTRSPGRRIVVVALALALTACTATRGLTNPAPETLHAELRHGQTVVVVLHNGATLRGTVIAVGNDGFALDTADGTRELTADQVRYIDYTRLHAGETARGAFAALAAGVATLAVVALLAIAAAR
jgi:hypothetical protein